MLAHEAKGICGGYRGSFIGTKAARKHARGHLCGEQLDDKRRLYFVCSEECAVGQGIIY